MGFYIEGDANIIHFSPWGWRRNWPNEKWMIYMIFMIFFSEQKLTLQTIKKLKLKKGERFKVKVSLDRKTKNTDIRILKSAFSLHQTKGFYDSSAPIRYNKSTRILSSCRLHIVRTTNFLIVFRGWPLMWSDFKFINGD